MSEYAEAMASAALRHVRDAHTLASGSRPSPDQAWHLIGFGPECALKAALSSEWQGRAIGHAGGMDARLSEWLLALDPAAHRRLIVSGRENPVPDWTPNHRYKRTGWLRTTSHNLPAVLADAADVVERRLISLWSAGDLSSEIFQEGT